MNKITSTFQQLGILIAVGAGLWGTSIPATQAVQLADGTVAFANPPKLLDAITTFRATRARGAKYYFTFFLPEAAKESVQKITINLRQGGDNINYKLDKTIAAVGTARNRTEEIAISNATFDEETETVTITFAKPISAGTTFTVGLKPKRNPDFGGTYLFGVTAYPDGEKSQGIYLGAARLQFDESSDNDFSL
ncbi:DUF2808 domain-containing protein [Waterburya agarophytonicola K14]|uniref:DUF2808 domain-containing protein n=1 Tax=Waterburya agarophytonicola KI4 TaxID=2874699 RepID=A0A964FFV0_9CYAN|nr:DUF2808 domain-containing protein [Waterburya agarophytonicola]MCC0175873.1 DUF2808 domain-containing protein [Waterburya agarophytonicola KI4]